MGTNALPPGIQSVLETLFELFSAYVAASTTRESRELHSQIIELFSRLGVASNEPLVQRAAEIFERIRQEPVVSVPELPTLPLRARNFVTARLRNLERSHDLILSTGARQLLRVPVAESAE